MTKIFRRNSGNGAFLPSVSGRGAANFSRTPRRVSAAERRSAADSENRAPGAKASGVSIASKSDAVPVEPMAERMPLEPPTPDTPDPPRGRPRTYQAVRAERERRAMQRVSSRSPIRSTSEEGESGSDITSRSLSPGPSSSISAPASSPDSPGRLPNRQRQPRRRAAESAARALRAVDADPSLWSSPSPSPSPSPPPRKAAPKRARPQPKADAKAEKKGGAKSQPKAEAKPEPKTRPQAEPKAEAKAEPKPQPKAEAKPQRLAESKTDSEAAPQQEQPDGGRPSRARRGGAEYGGGRVKTKELIREMIIRALETYEPRSRDQDPGMLRSIVLSMFSEVRLCAA